ncbi:MAG: hypothetical protein ACLPV8_03410 [Steroidobacteraceae bacterium]
MTAVPEILAPDDARFVEVTGYVEDMSRSMGFDSAFTACNGEVILPYA